MKKILALLPLLIVAACVAQSVGQGGNGGNTDLDRSIRGAQAQPPRACIGVQQLGTTRVDPQTRSILFEGRDGLLYVNRIREGCPNLHRHMTLVTNTPSGHLCEGDRIELRDVDGSSRISCLIGAFTPYRAGAGPPAPGG